MRKSFISLLLALAVLCSVFPSYVYADAMQIAFPDLAQNHWAYSYVMTLVNDGTVKGDDTGHFNPNNSVTRAEFVKMVGKGPTLREKDYDDVPSTHWAYEYVMYSGMSVMGNNFQPNIPITREEIIALLFSRAGNPSVVAPSVISSQKSKNSASANWAYTCGLIQGDDGLNLRLADTVTRAEAAALIIRARSINESSPRYAFPKVVSDELLKYVFNALNLFDFEYSPDKTITNGELAKAGLRLANDANTVKYTNYVYETPFEHEYATDIYLMGTQCTGADTINLAYCNKTANRKDTLAFLSYCALAKTGKVNSVNYFDSYYDDLPKLERNKMNSMLSWAFTYGIKLEADNNLKPDSAVTCRDIAAILIQLDHVTAGLGSGVTSNLAASGKEYTKVNYKLLKQPAKFPATANKFNYIISDLPQEVYTTPFEIIKQEGGDLIPDCKNIFNFGREFSPLFVSQLNLVSTKLKNEKGIDVLFTFYPSLASTCSVGFVYRIECYVKNAGNGTHKYNEVFAGNINKNVDFTFKTGDTFFCDVVTPKEFNQIQFGQVIEIAYEE